MNKKGKKKLGMVLLLISFVLIGYGAYLCIFSPKNVMLKMIETELKDLFESNDTIKEKLKLISKGSLEMASEGQTAKIDLDTTVYIDEQTEKTLLDFGMKNNEVDFLSYKIYLAENKLYFKDSENAKLQYIEFSDSQEDSLFTDFEIEELKRIFKDQLIKNLPDKNFTKSKENTTINDNNLETVKYDMKVTYLDIYNIINGIVLEIKESEKLSRINTQLSKAINSNEEFSKELKNSVIGNNNENDIVFDYSIYSLKNNIVKHEIKSGNDVVSFGKYEKETDINDYEFFVKQNNIKTISASIIGEKNSSKINATFDAYILEGQAVNSNEKDSLTLNLYATTSKEKAIASFSYEKPLSTNSNEYSYSLNFQMPSIKLNLNNTISKNQDVPDFDVSGASKLDLGDEFQSVPMPSSFLEAFIYSIGFTVYSNKPIINSAQNSAANIAFNI